MYGTQGGKSVQSTPAWNGTPGHSFHGHVHICCEGWQSIHVPLYVHICLKVGETTGLLLFIFYLHIFGGKVGIVQVQHHYVNIYKDWQSTTGLPLYVHIWCTDWESTGRLSMLYTCNKG